MRLLQISARRGPARLLARVALAFFLLSACAPVADALASEGVAEVPAGAAPGHHASPKKGVNWASWDYGHGKVHANPPVLIAVINFSIVLFGLVYFVRKPLGTFLATRQRRIKDDLQAAAELREQARARLAEIDTKLDGLEREIVQIRDGVAADAEAEKARLIEAAEREAQAIVHAAERTLALEVERAKRRLEVGAVQAALQAADKLLRRELSAQDQHRLRDEYFAQIQESGGGH